MVGIRTTVPYLIVGRSDTQPSGQRGVCDDAGQWDERSCLREIPASIEIIAGIADVKSFPESADALRAKIEALLDVIPPERLLVSSSCGCGRVPHDEAIELMRNLVSAAA